MPTLTVDYIEIKAYDDNGLAWFEIITPRGGAEWNYVQHDMNAGRALAYDETAFADHAEMVAFVRSFYTLRNLVNRCGHELLTRVVVNVKCAD